ncbi:MAG: hypothetical protein R2722_11700 [Tessaracoccus sp.]
MAPRHLDSNLVAINYVLTVYGLWYSASLFSRGAGAPSTWDAMLSLGAGEEGGSLSLRLVP